VNYVGGVLPRPVDLAADELALGANRVTPTRSG
jgi:hypothetical protein